MSLAQIEEIEKKVKPIIERMSLEVVKKRPENIVWNNNIIIINNLI